MSLTDILTHHADRHPDALAFEYEGVETSWGTLLESTRQTAGALRAAGVRAGDVVGVLALNSTRFVEVMHGISHLGAIFMPLNWRLAGPELAYIVDHAGVRILVTEPELGELITSDVSCSVVNMSDLSGAAEVDDPAPTSPADVHRLMYTSGTTARPKGVMITYANLWAKNHAHTIEFRVTREAIGLAVGPLYHVGALDLTTSTLEHVGAPSHILRRFEPAATLEAIERHRPSHIWLAPAMINQLVAHHDAQSRDLSSVQVIIDGGEKMPLPLIEKVLHTFPNAWFADCYGMTETVSGDTVLDKGRTRSKLGSVGKPVMHMQVRTVRADGTDCEPGEAGEVIMRGPKVCKGYWRDEEATARTIRDGWLYTGDLGVLDGDGYLFIVDRVKDVIISGGENIASSEVERVLHEHPAISEVAVVGRPDERWSEVPVAFCVPVAGATLEPDELTEHCRRSLARFKVPKAFELLDALPRNPSGKVLKRELRELAARSGAGL